MSFLRPSGLFTGAMWSPKSPVLNGDRRISYHVSSNKTSFGESKYDPCLILNQCFFLFLAIGFPSFCRDKKPTNKTIFTFDVSMTVISGHPREKF